MTRKKKDNFNKIDNSSKNKVLEAAELIFAEKGYDGAGVDEIARKSGLNKSVLYYYFNSKESLLKELIQKHIHDTSLQVETIFNSINLLSQDELNNIIDVIIEIIFEKRNIFRVITIEGLKMGTNDFFLFELLDPIFQKIMEKLKSGGWKISYNIKFLIKIFFFLTIPVVVFFTVSEKWAEFYNTTWHNSKKIFINELKKLYSEILKD
jgi:AcrR family transcriptional regulator